MEIIIQVSIFCKLIENKEVAIIVSTKREKEVDEMGDYSNRSTRRFGLRDKFAYMMGDVGCNAVLNFANSYLLIFYTKVMGVSGAVIGTIFMLARFVDAFTDVGMGRIVDTHTFKNGDRFRPWIGIMSVPLVVINCAMYNYLLADATMGLKIGWLIVTYLLFGSICYTAVNIPYGAMSNVITDDAGERASLSTWRSMGSQIAGVVMGMVLPMVVYIKDKDGNSIVSGSRFFMMSLILGIAALVALTICRVWSTERLHITDQGKQEKQHTGKVIITCLKDKTLLINLGYSIFVNASYQIFTAFNQYLFLDYFKNTSLSGLSSLIMFAGMVIPAAFVTRLSKKYGKKEVGLTGLTIAAAAYLCIFTLRIANPVLYFVLIFVAFLGLGMNIMIGYAMINDCIDNHFLVSGDRVEGTVYAMTSFTSKLAGALCAGIGGWGLAWINYDELAAVQTEAVSQGVFNIAVGLPMACFIFAAFLMIIYPLNKKRVDENREKIEKYRV